MRCLPLNKSVKQISKYHFKYYATPTMHLSNSVSDPFLSLGDTLMQVWYFIQILILLLIVLCHFPCRVAIWAFYEIFISRNAAHNIKLTNGRISPLNLITCHITSLSLFFFVCSVFVFRGASSVWHPDLNKAFSLVWLFISMETDKPRVHLVPVHLDTPMFRTVSVPFV